MLDASQYINIVGFGYSVNEGIKLIEQQQPDVVFLDVEMPVKNGLNCLRHLLNLNLKSSLLPVMINTPLELLNFPPLIICLSQSIPRSLTLQF